MRRFIILETIFVIWTIPSFSQENQGVAQAVETIQNIYMSDSSDIFFDLTAIPEELLAKIEAFNDSISYSFVTYRGNSDKQKKKNQEKISKGKEGYRTSSFIANRKEK